MSEARQYVDWITDLGSNLLGACAEVTLEMVEDFPELRRVRGHYLCLIWGRRAHWWCVAPDGTIVDPTAEQFPSKGIGEYVPWTEGAKEPTGKCANCGGEVFNGDNFCNDDCADATVAYLNATVPLP